jgi:hypothetical protein
MGMLRNVRHEFFVREYVKTGGNGAEAYRRIAARFPNKRLRNPDAAKVIAHHIRRRPEVQRRERELISLMVKKSDITIERVLSNLEDAFITAKNQAKPSEMTNATMAQAKVVGLLRDRVETGGVGEFDGTEDVSAILEKVAEERGPEAALLLAQAFGYGPEEPSTTEQPQGEDAQLAKAIPPTDAVN